MSKITIHSNVFKGIVNEEWRPINGFPGYEVSDKGRIRSFKSGKAKILKPRPTRDGYLLVALFNEGKRYERTVHSLVLETFVGNPGSKLECNHRNGIKSDNRLQNLEFVSRSENLKHAYRIGLKSAKGEKNSQAKLTTEEVLQIRDMLVEGVPLCEIAEIFNVSPSCIYEIKSGRNWSHVTGIKPNLKNSGKSTLITINLNFWLSREAF